MKEKNSQSVHTDIYLAVGIDDEEEGKEDEEDDERLDERIQQYIDENETFYAASDSEIATAAVECERLVQECEEGETEVKEMAWREVEGKSIHPRLPRQANTSLIFHNRNLPARRNRTRKR